MDPKARSYVKKNQIDNAIKAYETLLTRKGVNNFWIINPIFHYRIARAL